MATVQDILQIPELELKLLAGARCAVNQVRWVHVAEVPGAVENLKGGELLLTAGDGFTGSAAEQARHLDELVERGIAGLGFASACRSSRFRVAWR
jgi:PucR family transcriptional regulator, purine catabolism regulatory protein